MKVSSWRDLPAARQRGEDPYAILQAIMAEGSGALGSAAIQECLRAIGSGSSPWIQLARLLVH